MKTCWPARENGRVEGKAAKAPKSIRPLLAQECGGRRVVNVGRARTLPMRRTRGGEGRPQLRARRTPRPGRATLSVCVIAGNERTDRRLPGLGRPGGRGRRGRSRSADRTRDRAPGGGGSCVAGLPGLVAQKTSRSSRRPATGAVLAADERVSPGSRRASRRARRGSGAVAGYRCAPDFLPRTLDPPRGWYPDWSSAWCAAAAAAGRGSTRTTGSTRTAPSPPSPGTSSTTPTGTSPTTADDRPLHTMGPQLHRAGARRAACGWAVHPPLRFLEDVPAQAGFLTGCRASSSRCSAAPSRSSSTRTLGTGRGVRRGGARGARPALGLARSAAAAQAARPRSAGGTLLVLHRRRKSSAPAPGGLPDARSRSSCRR